MLETDEEVDALIESRSRKICFATRADKKTLVEAPSKMHELYEELSKDTPIPIDMRI